VHGEQCKKHNIQGGSFSGGTAAIDFSQVDWKISLDPVILHQKMQTGNNIFKVSK